VVNPEQARSFLRAVAEVNDSMTLFFAVMYFSPRSGRPRQSP
jgi:hypothetical protein